MNDKTTESTTPVTEFAGTAAPAKKAVVRRTRPKVISMTVAQIEDAIFKLDGVRIVIRADASLVIPGAKFNYKRGFNDTPHKTLLARVAHLLKGYTDKKLTFMIVDGSGNTTFKPAVTVSQIRRTYAYPIK